ncbi:hypothetical protein F5X99DRAFT_41251 [Biscogniauxia marginata]|nr:hypothetical protein F5X99DRAFT_41251 [Biscogniauxia marginata]
MAGERGSETKETPACQTNQDFFSFFFFLLFLLLFSFLLSISISSLLVFAEPFLCVCVCVCANGSGLIKVSTKMQYNPRLRRAAWEVWSILAKMKCLIAPIVVQLPFLLSFCFASLVFSVTSSISIFVYVSAVQHRLSEAEKLDVG